MTGHTRNGESGATIIEFALVAFIFFLIMWGIFEFGRAFYVRNSTQHLTRCIARAAAVKLPDQEYGATPAKKECLISVGSSETELFWPFYDLAASDMSDVFRVRYCYQGAGGEVCAQSAPLDQVQECLSPIPNQCVKYVKVDVPDEKLEIFGMFVAWLGSSKDLNEPMATTTVPAESMGFKPPASP